MINDKCLFGKADIRHKCIYVGWSQDLPSKLALPGQLMTLHPRQVICCTLYIAHYTLHITHHMTHTHTLHDTLPRQLTTLHPRQIIAGPAHCILHIAHYTLNCSIHAVCRLLHTVGAEWNVICYAAYCALCTTHITLRIVHHPPMLQNIHSVQSHKQGYIFIEHSLHCVLHSTLTILVWK